jgi:glycosyltransferase involved in cell wall biosynthesis
MRILFAADVAPDPDSGAAGTEWQTIQALRRRGHEVDEIWAAELGRRIQHGNLHYLLELPRRYRQVIEERCQHRDYDVFHVNQGHCYQAALAHRQSNRHGVFVCRSHGLDDYAMGLLAPWKRLLGVRDRRGAKALVGGVVDSLLHRHDRLAYAYADGVLVSASNDARYLTTTMGVPPSRVACIPQAPAAAFVASPAPLMDEARMHRILHVGGFAYWKGVHAVAAAANQLLPTASHLRMTWVCRVDEHAAVRALLDERVLAQVDLVGWMPQEALREIYDSHGIFLCPSLFEGFGKVFLEAMARGMIVVGTATGGMPDVIRDGIDGLIVGFNDPDAIRTTVENLRNDIGLTVSMSDAAAIRAREYSWDRVACETEDFYIRLLGMRRGEAVN